MTKIIVQLYVENLLKVLKTRTALTRNGLAEFRCAPYSRALKRHSNQKTIDKNKKYMVKSTIEMREQNDKELHHRHRRKRKSRAAL